MAAQPFILTIDGVRLFCYPSDIWLKEMNEKEDWRNDRLFLKIYEDNANAKLSDERYAMMSTTYENEQTELKAEVKKLQEDIQVQEQKIQNLEVFIKRVKKYITLKELTPYALRELVKGIYVEAPDKSSGKRKQKAHIEYDLVGFIPVDELMKAEKVWPKSYLFRKNAILLFYEHCPIATPLLW